MKPAETIEGKQHETKSSVKEYSISKEREHELRRRWGRTTWSKGYGKQRQHMNGNWRLKADQTAKRKWTRLRTKVTEQAVSSKIMEIVRESYER